jgi:cytochrome c oxidase assembly protein subunit 15
MGTSGLPNRLLHWFAFFVSCGVLVLICSGGLVTSHEAGLAVPDWPNSFGYSMFLFPVSRWVGGVFFEHTHRLIASGVGLLTLVLCGLTLVIEQRRWVQWLAGTAVFTVIIQGVLGGLRVTEHDALLGLFHGCLAQSFFCLTATIALVTSKFWSEMKAAANGNAIRRLRSWTIAITIMVFIQLALGASMRHSHAGLSIPDFPTAYGGILPPVDTDSIAAINEVRVSTKAQPPISAGLILLQYVHRIWAAMIVIALTCVAAGMIRQRQLASGIRSAAGFWLILVFVQFALGAWTIWSNKAADVATAHVFVGALILMTGVLLSVTLSAIVARSAGSQVPWADTKQKEVAQA